MIASFPQPKRQPWRPDVDLALYSEVSAAEHEERLAWVRWVFQGVRGRCRTLIFLTESTERVPLLKDWQRYLDQTWLPQLAPALLQSWRAAHEGNDLALIPVTQKLNLEMSLAKCERSLVAGELLLQATQGAKYQGALGRFRQQVAEGKAEPHLPVVWAALAAIFQLPPVDLLAAYLREEWLTAIRDVSHHAEPQGPLSFAALAHRALRQADMIGLQEVVS